MWCAASHQLDGMGWAGFYCEDCNIAEPLPGEAPKEPRGVG